MTISSKIARLADLTSVVCVRISQYLSGSPSRYRAETEPFPEVDVRSQPDIFLLEVGSLLQHTGKEQREFGHGRILYDKILQLSDSLPPDLHLNVLEFGTARGFSCVVMAKALHDSQRSGSVVSIDIIRHDSNSYTARNRPPEIRYPRSYLMSPWKALVDDRVFFLAGPSSLALEVLQSRRFPFVFIDEHHVYKNTKRDLRFASMCQVPGDMILLDDHSPKFPGVVRAVEEFVQSGTYESEKIALSTDRNMMLLTRRSTS